MKYQQWSQNPTRFLAMTGYKIEQFDQLLPFFVEAHDQYLERFHLDGRPRSMARRFTMYANSPLKTHAERLTFILSYLKINPLQEDHADRFGLTQKQVNGFVHGLKPILDKALTSARVMPAQTDAQLQERITALNQDPQSPLVLMHDATERPVPRPVDPVQQGALYSGKKKRHTLKNTFIITALSFILFLSKSVAGRIHDKYIGDHAYRIPAGVELWQDTGYQGYGPIGVTVYQPIKKPRGRELTDAQKSYNQSVSRVRVQIEHVIGSSKRYRIVKDVCRVRKAGFIETILHTCAGLHNFRVVSNPFKYPNYQKPKLT